MKQNFINNKRTSHEYTNETNDNIASISTNIPSHTSSLESHRKYFTPL